ncbi:MAG TPA: phytanoyl-CoA dioxygenase family protein, partial [Myxococcales bacterium]|nr:phytanoyl-CoA dioxygenase family protein [Myxococcales bacterium]HIN84858.1 phytanoyl-CoA dioxygenase family protein [Myxococcales bacterium]
MTVLDSDQISHFNREGYLVVRNAIDPTLIKPIKEHLSSLVNSGYNSEFRRLDVHRDDSTVLVWMKDVHCQIPSLATLLHHKTLTSMAAQLLNESVEVRLLLDALFYKNGQNGGAVGWHQDYSYWQQVEPACPIAAWIALTDSCEENGCLKVIPGSHKWGLMPGNWTNAFSEDPDELLNHPQVKAEQGAVQPQFIELKVGDVSFHHSL